MTISRWAGADFSRFFLPSTPSATRSVSSRYAVARETWAMAVYFSVLMPPAKPSGPASNSLFSTLRWLALRGGRMGVIGGFSSVCREKDRARQRQPGSGKFYFDSG
jgi:hypothetical protein